MNFCFPGFKRGLSISILMLAAFTQAGLSQEAASPYIDISLSIFDANLPQTQEQLREEDIFRSVRNAEARYFPAFLGMKLIQSGHWGAVRIIPEPDDTAELLVTGDIVHSDGNRLELLIDATDSTGRQWIKQTYSATAREGVSLYQSAENSDPFEALYNQMVNDLALVYSGLSASEITRIKSVSSLRYAASLAPEAFTAFLERTEAGRYQIIRLPADNDPIMQRVQEIREHEYVFIDVVDEQYQSFFQNVKSLYDLWRRFDREQQASSTSFEERQLNSSSDFTPGSYRALRESYDNYRWARMQDQYLQQLAQGFANEIQPTEIKLEDSVYNLTGSMEEQYREWRAILREFFILEMETAGF